MDAKEFKNDPIVFAYKESWLKKLAKNDYGYELSEDEIPYFQEAMLNCEIAGIALFNMLPIALEFIIEHPEKCDWSKVDASIREQMKESLISSHKRYFTPSPFGKECRYPVWHEIHRSNSKKGKQKSKRIIYGYVNSPEDAKKLSQLSKNNNH